MQESRRALRALEGHLSEVLDVSDANEVVDRLERTVSEDYLDAALDRQRAQLDRALEQHRADVAHALEQQSARFDERLAGQIDHMAAMWRRDLLLVSGAQFFALAAAVAALVGLG